MQKINSKRNIQNQLRKLFSRFGVSLQPTHNSLQQSAGFTIVETLVALSIFAVSLTAIISVTAEGIGNTTSAKNRLTATYLAQEQIEYIRALRLTGTSFGFTGLLGFVNMFSDTNTCSLDQKCVILSTHTPLAFPVRCGNQVDCSDYSLYRQDVLLGGYLYSDSGGVGGDIELPFDRYVVLSTPPGGSGDQLIVTSTVNWTDRGGRERSTVLTETLTDWIPTL